MKILRSHLMGKWCAAEADPYAILHDPTTEDPLAKASSAGIDFRAAVDHQAGPAATLCEKTAVPAVGPSANLDESAVGLTHQLDQRERDTVLLVLRPLVKPL